MYPAAPPPPAESGQASGGLWPPIVAIGVLGLVTTLLGLLPWHRPVWAPSSAWMLTGVPGQMWLLVVGATLVCVVVAVLVTRRAVDMSPRRVTTWLWVGLLLLAAAALVWNALYDAALSTIDYGAAIPVFHWLFTFAPAVLAGVIFSGGRDPRTRRSAALGTGVVTVPLFALSWGLTGPPGFSLAALVAAVLPTVVLGAAPLAGGVALAGVIGRQPHRPAPWPYPPPR